jgi:hypothetical protein
MTTGDRAECALPRVGASARACRDPASALEGSSLLHADPVRTRDYSLRGVRPRTTLRGAARRLRLGRALRVGRNDWYLAPSGSATAILKVRHGIVQEIGIANRRLTRSRRADRTFVTSFS